MNSICRWRGWCILGLALILSVSSITVSYAQPSAKRAGYPLDKMPLLRLVLRLLQKFYIDPTQFNAAKMHRSGLKALERRLADIRVTWSKKNKRYTVQLGPHTQHFALPNFIGLFDVWLRLQPVAKFVQKHYQGDVPISEIEYAMVIGVMSTLDKQTRVISRQILMRRQALRPRQKSGKIGAVLSWNKKKKIIVIRRVVPDGPADLSGLQANDHIIAINEKPIQGGTLREWIGKIIGLRGSRIALHIQRKGWTKPRRIVLIRAKMARPLVTGHLLPGKIGYIHLRQFSGGVSLLIREELARLRRKAKGTLLGLALDLRNNPGGRVVEAVAIASIFVERGQVVTYAGANIKRRTYNVSGKNVEALYPMVVMLSDNSASASELLSGALQGHQRALVIGQRSYGKGTVQSVSTIRSLGLMYRVTVAQYMVPPDRSIQMVGVDPDIALKPISVKPGRIRYYSTPFRDRAARKKRWPQFLQQNLDTHQAKYLMEIPYLAHPMPGQSKKSKKKSKKSKRTIKRPSMRSWFMDPDHALGHDFEVWVARYMLANAKSGRRKLFYEQVKRSLQKLQRQQEQRIIRSLKHYKTNWIRPRKVRVKAKLKASVMLVGAKSPVSTGKRFKIRLTVKNIGKGTAYRVRSIIRSKLRSLRYQELLLGKIDAGRSVSRDLEVKLPHSLKSGVDPLSFVLEADGAEPTSTMTFPLAWRSLPRPRYSIGYQIADPSPDGNGDGRIQAGERVHLFVTIKQHGQSAPTNPKATMFMERVRVQQPRISIKKLVSGKPQTVVFSLRVPDNARPGTRYSTLTLTERKLGLRVKHQLRLSIARPFLGSRPQPKKWAECRSTKIYNSPSLGKHPIAWMQSSSKVRWLRTFRHAIQIALPVPRIDVKSLKNDALRKAVPRYISAWVSRKACKAVLMGPYQLSGLRWFYHFVPPNIRSADGDSLRVGKAAHTLSLDIQSSHGLRDFYLVLNGQKVHYQPVQYKKPEGLKRVKAKVALTLKPGLNRIRLVARTLQGSFSHIFTRSFIK